MAGEEFKQSNNAEAAAPKAARVEESSSNVGLIVFLTAVVVIALLGYFTSRAALSVDMVNARLQVWADAVKESAARKGYDASFTHGAIAIEGGLFSKRAVISEPVITFSRNGQVARSFATKIVEIQPDSADMDKLRVVFSAPLTIKWDDMEARRFELATSLEVDVAKTASGQSYETFLPTQISVFKAADDGVDAIPYMTIETKLGAKLKGVVGLDNDEYSQVLSLGQTTMKTADRTTSFSAVEIKSEAAKEDAARLTHYDVTISKLQTSGVLAVFAPVDIVANVDKEMASAISEDEHDAHRDYSYFINDLSFFSGNSTLKVEGKFDVVKDEILPMGSADVTLSQVGTLIGRLKKAGILDDRSEEVTRSIFKRIASKWNTKEDVVQFALEREYGGGFFIGDVTFEELLATALKQYLLGVTQPEIKAPSDDEDMPEADIISNGGLEHEAAPADAANAPEATGEEKTAPQEEPKASDKPAEMSNPEAPAHENADAPQEATQSPEATTPEAAPEEKGSLLERLFPSSKPEEAGEVSVDESKEAPTAMESLEDMEKHEASKESKDAAPKE